MRLGPFEPAFQCIASCSGILVPLLGNHDEMLLGLRTGRPPTSWLIGMGGSATLDSYGPGQDLGLIPEEHHDFLAGCHDFFETDTHIFVHANYFPDIPMAEQDGSTLRWESLRETTPGPHESGKTVILGHTSALPHSRCKRPFSGPERPRIPGKRGPLCRLAALEHRECGRTHTSQKTGEILDLGHLKCIDTFCYGGGWLTAQEVRSEEVWQADREGELRR